MSKEPKTAIIVQLKTEAIDFTPIYYLKIARNLRAGTVLRFDTAETEIYEE